MACSLSLMLPVAGGRLERYAVRGGAPFATHPPTRPFTRIAYSAAHVVADPLAAVDPWLGAAIDWDATIAYRQRLWSLGLGVAEAMDTAQRGMGLDWPTSLELIRRSLDAARDVPGALVASGCGTDHLDPASAQRRRRRHPRLRRADGRDRGARRQAHRDGEPRARARRQEPCRLRARLRPRADAVAPAGDPALARRRCSTRSSPATGSAARRTTATPSTGR